MSKQQHPAQYNGWAVVTAMPVGWAVDKHAGSPYPSSVFITPAGTSPLYDRRRMILVTNKPISNVDKSLYQGS